MNYKVADFIIRIKNASMAKRREVLVPYSKMAKALGKILLKDNFLEEVTEEKKDDKKVLSLRITYEKRVPVLTDVLLVSKPSLRVYVKPKDIKERQRRSQNTLIVSTSKGVMNGREALQKGVGGELLFEIW